MGFGGVDSLFPVIAVVDPEFDGQRTAYCTAYQEFDALFHGTEDVIFPAASPMSDMNGVSTSEMWRLSRQDSSDGQGFRARAHVALGIRFPAL